ncbi:MAG: AMIN domain-containing protein, partial [Bryobacterales bacterium]|nr:AMIN domain-containing protein [Bryobacterales bacterium]
MARRAGSTELPATPLWAALLLTLPLYGGSGELSLTAIRFWSLADVTRIAIETDGPFTFRTDRLSRPDRVFFDLRGAKSALSDKGLHVIPVNDPRVRQVRVAEPQPSITRVVIDLAEGPLDIVTSQLSVPDRLMVEVRMKGVEP